MKVDKCRELSENMVMFDVEHFEEMTPQCRGKVSYVSEVESTNDEAKKLVREGKAVSGMLFLADYQTQGRGRGGNQWVCPRGAGLLFSLLLEPDEAAAFWNRMSLAVGLAIVDVLGGLELDVKLKWPNDLYLGGKKLGGVLIENVNGFLIVGVGLNVDVEEFPEEVAARAISLANVCGDRVNREKLLSDIVKMIFKYGSLIGDHFGYLRERVMECFYLKEQRVEMKVNGDILEGDVLGLSENGYLLVACEDGLEEICNATEIKILK